MFTDTESGRLPDENGVFDVAQLPMWDSSLSLQIKGFLHLLPLYIYFFI